MIGRDYDGGWECQAGGSLYYPGEACFGLLRLHALTNHAAYLDGATQGLLYLARSREDTAWLMVPADHWALIATAALLAGNPAAETRRRVLEHAEKVVRKMLFEIGWQWAVCPVATRLEGILAVWPFLSASLQAMARGRVRTADACPEKRPRVSDTFTRGKQ